jgi:hypothetical protein
MSRLNATLSTHIKNEDFFAFDTSETKSIENEINERGSYGFFRFALNEFQTRDLR